MSQKWFCLLALPAGILLSHQISFQYFMSLWEQIFTDSKRLLSSLKKLQKWIFITNFGLVNLIHWGRCILRRFDFWPDIWWSWNLLLFSTLSISPTKRGFICMIKFSIKTFVLCGCLNLFLTYLILPHSLQTSAYMHVLFFFWYHTF